MKKTIAILLSVSCLFGLNSCFKTEEDIFDQSPAQRLNKLTSDYREVLSGSENGWVLQYFASETEQGYPFVMKFDKSGKVTSPATTACRPVVYIKRNHRLTISYRICRLC